MDEIPLYVIGVLFVATLVRSTFGFGEALVAVPLLALCVPVEVAVPVAALLSVVVAAGVLVQDAGLVERRSAAWLIATTAIGIPLGLLVLRTVDERVVKIALAAVIFGGWHPIRATLAALMFGFATNLGSALGTFGSPVPNDFLLMLPYLVTIFAVAGFVGRVRPPAAAGRPYIKS